MDDESLVQYGTPLQPLDEESAHTSKALRLSDQVATDKQGRRRFHGAFTGGFSAGFFNSVGSKEGWTPSTFVSSRSKRAEKFSHNNPSTYMDEEDFDSFGIAAERIQATSDYEDPHQQRKRKKIDEHRGPIPGKPVLEELLKPVNVTVGMRLLIKLGWRPGQGIGPRVTKREKKSRKKEGKTPFKKKSNEEKGANSSSETEDEEDFSSVGFAPDDVETEHRQKPKSDFFGLGYTPLARGNVLGTKCLSQSLNLMEKKKRIAISGQAFGVGAFEEEDEDIYSREDLSSYDFELGPSSDATHRKESRWDPHIQKLEECLEGFSLSREIFPKPEPVLLPQLPANFKPWHQSYRKRFERRDGDGDASAARLSCEQRSRMISQPPSVEVRSGVRDGASAPPPPPRPLRAQPHKEASLAARGSQRPDVFPSCMTEWEKEREKEEFARASGLRKPLIPISMSSRFTSASFEDGPMKGFSEGLNTMSDASAKERGTAWKAVLLQEETREDVKAAKTKMFGRLTQTRCQWNPEKILCKRFNVPHPFPHSPAGASSQPKEKLNIFSFLSKTVVPENALKSLSKAPSSTTPTEPVELEMHQTKEEEENYGLKVPVSNPPSMDLFKAIFEDSSDSEAEEASTEPPQKEVEDLGNAALGSQSSLVETNNDAQNNKDSLGPASERDASNHSLISRSELDSTYLASRAKGIFKGIDFAALNEYRNVAKKAESDSEASRFASRARRSSSKSSTSSTETSDDEQGKVSPLHKDEYGPEPPPASFSFSSGFELSKCLQKVPLSKSLLEIERRKSKERKSKHKKKSKRKKKEEKTINEGKRQSQKRKHKKHKS